jgi:hypothetical protein
MEVCSSCGDESDNVYFVSGSVSRRLRINILCRDCWERHVRQETREMVYNPLRSPPPVGARAVG